jgi:hypothetical protein
LTICRQHLLALKTGRTDQKFDELRAAQDARVARTPNGTERERFAAVNQYGQPAKNQTC